MALPRRATRWERDCAQSHDLILNDGLFDQAKSLIPIFEAGMAEIAANHANIGENRGKGLMGALEAVRDAATKTPFEGHLSVSERIANTCTDHGLICRPLGQSIVLCPPFIMTEAQMAEMFEKLDAALTQVFKDVA